MPVRFARVDENLLRGGAPELMEIPILRDVWGVRKIVSLDGSSGNHIVNACKQLGLDHEIIPLTNGNDKRFNEIPKRVFEWAENGPTYIHCRHGKDRTGASCAIYRVLVDGWDVDDAIAEAASFGMGWNVSKDTRRSFYEVVRRCVDKYKHDKNFNLDSPDIVSNQRDKLEELQPIPMPGTFNPVSSDFTDSGPIVPGQQSFAPYLDVTQDHLNRPALHRRRELLRLANVQIYRFCRPSDVQIYNTLWTTSPHSAVEQGQANLPDWQKADAKLFSATLSNNASIITFAQEPTKTLIQAAMLNGADVVLFKGVYSEQYFIIDPAVIMDIKMMGTDANDAPLVGLHDNYEGAANWVFPGSGPGMVPGLSGGAGGFAGFVQVPGQQF